MTFSDAYNQTSGFRRTLKFYMTATSPCPYLEGKRERKAFTSLSISDADAVHNALSKSGFRRSQTIAYRPACPSCNACRSVRVPVRDFEFTRRRRRIMNVNKDVIGTPVKSEASREQYRLLKKYLASRHPGGGMSDMSSRDYFSMVNDSPVQSMVLEYRLGNDPDAPLIAAAITDIMRDGLSMVYSFFDPEFATRSLGNYVILDHIQRTADLGLPHVYLGYWVENSPKMAYKRDFGPLEVLNGDRWDELDLTTATAPTQIAPQTGKTQHDQNQQT